MKLEDLSDPNSGYYRDNLLALCEALRILGDAPNTGDWFWEFIHFLQELGADPEKANANHRELALMIYEAANNQNVLDLLALIKDKPK